MLKYINKIFQVFIDILVFIITVLILFSLYNFISLKVLDKEYSIEKGVQEAKTYTDDSLSWYEDNTQS